MDAHTARCLQLSTSIQAPYNGPYRHNRFESMNRSRYNPQQSSSQHASPMRMQQQRATSMPAVSHYSQPAPNATAFKHNFQNPMMGQGFHPTSGFDDAALFATASNVMGGDASWDPTMMVKPESVGMSFLDQDVDFSQTFGMTTDGSDLIHLTEQDHQVTAHNPMSPDRHSLTSNSSDSNGTELSDLGDNNGMPLLAQDIPMATVEEEESMGDFRARARSTSRAPMARASSSRRYRRNPYSFDGHRRSSSVMSTASSVGSGHHMSVPPTQCCSPVNECHDDFGQLDFGQLDFGNGRPAVSDDLFAMDHMHGMPHGGFAPDLIAPQPKYAAAEQMFLQQGFEDPLFAAPILPSSNAAHDLSRASVDEFAEYAEEPDLFGALSEEPSVPSEEDMNPADESMKPQEQETRFEGDLYTPRFVRGTGVNREGYCGLCKPGRWLVLKNSAYWYDKSFTHGISAATGQPFDGPKETRRMSGNPDVWEGLCGCCNEWIALISNKKKGTTWFRHAYKCHSKNNNKDGKKKNAKGKKGEKESSVEPQVEASLPPSQRVSPQPPSMPAGYPPHMLPPHALPQQYMPQQAPQRMLSPPQQQQHMQAMGSFY